MNTTASRVGPPPIPKEHGAWAVLLVPLLIGVSVGKAADFQWLYLLCAALAVFMSYVPAKVVMRNFTGHTQPALKVYQATFWLCVYAGLALLFLAPLLARGRWTLLPLGALAVLFFFGSFLAAERYPRSLAGDLLAVLGLTLTAPAAYYVSQERLDTVAASAWLLTFLFFGGNVVYVAMKIRTSGMKRDSLDLTEKISLGKANLMYHLFALAGVSALGAFQFLGRYAFLAFVPVTAHAIYGTMTLSSRVRFKNLGLILVAQSLLFGILLRVSI